ncbi:hypothetical protein AJ80_08428 [Polytolypa hystricis UAMH7299]|uniref:Uncharacterized protein n=1 Tax=Polytolypa hystricis (strain UAMH7299) TaxID=1447883 RepID=A0A2B7X899_POLH7|nr:hypothetical protein AJ80_08428 [Polytolypa hystricis UAMH7299]
MPHLTGAAFGSGDALDSLICSTFVDPSIPCNLVGAASFGIREALLPANSDGSSRLLQAITDKRLCMSLLWNAVVCSHQATEFLTLALQVPPICLPAAFWTNTTQSFLQVTYDPDNLREETIRRADEFINSYYCRPETLDPRTPAPPFGSTCTENLSLDVRLHYQYRHTPLTWKSYWVQLSGGKVPASLRHRIKPAPPVQRRYFGTKNEKVLEEEGIRKQSNTSDTAEELSWGATSRLFNWHRHNDGGLWLDDRTRDIEGIRQLQRHAWIIDPFDDGGRYDSVKKDEDKPDIDLESISQWIAEFEASRPSIEE